MAVVDSPLDSMTFSTRHEFPPTEQVLKPVRWLTLTPRYEGYYCTLEAILPCWLFCGLNILQLGRIIDCFSFLAAFLTSSSTEGATPQGKGFQVSSQVIPPSYEGKKKDKFLWESTSF